MFIEISFIEYINYSFSINIKEGEKIKLTPIPYKNRNLIDSEIEKKNIITAKRSAILMRRVEYTHLIKKHKLKNLENYEYSKNLMNLTNKLCLLKGAVLIIEDWWKKIKRMRSKKKKKKGEGKKINIINYELFGKSELDYSINFTKPNILNENHINFDNNNCGFGYIYYKNDE